MLHCCCLLACFAKDVFALDPVIVVLDSEEWDSAVFGLFDLFDSSFEAVSVILSEFLYYVSDSLSWVDDLPVVRSLLGRWLLLELLLVHQYV